MDAIDRTGITSSNYPRQDSVKKVSTEVVSSEELCIDVDEMKELFYMMRGIQVGSDSKNRDHWA
jgi:hypothetical protein